MVALAFTVVVVPLTVQVPATVPVSWLTGSDKDERVVKLEFELAVTFTAFPEIFPVTCEPGNESADNVVKLELELPVTFAAFPEMFPVT